MDSILPLRYTSSVTSGPKSRSMASQGGVHGISLSMRSYRVDHSRELADAGHQLISVRTSSNLVGRFGGLRILAHQGSMRRMCSASLEADLLVEPRLHPPPRRTNRGSPGGERQLLYVLSSAPYEYQSAFRWRSSTDSPYLKDGNDVQM
jgi:hypothetical protein